jgi:hypothetical protein
MNLRPERQTDFDIQCPTSQTDRQTEILPMISMNFDLLKTDRTKIIKAKLVLIDVTATALMSTATHFHVS